MHLSKKFLQGALPVLLAALLAILPLTLRAEAEFVVPGSESEEVSDSMQLPLPALNAHEASDSTLTLFTNSYDQLTLYEGDMLTYRFTPALSDSYIFRSFPSPDAPLPEVSVRLIREKDGVLLAQSDRMAGFHIAGKLAAEEACLLEITAHSDGQIALGVMLDARGRCFDNPISLPGESVRYAKTIVRPRDVHWFRFTAPVSGRYMIRTEKTGDGMLDTIGYLTDENGMLLALNDDILFPGDKNFLIEYELEAGDTYYVRISALSNLTGAYRLVLTVPQEGQSPPSAVTLSRHDLVMDVEQEHQLSVSMEPAGASGEVVYASSDSGIVSVEPDGRVRALSAGQAEVWAISGGGVSDRCRITVRPVEVTGMTFDIESVTLRVEEQLTLRPVFTPANASDQTARYHSSDESVVRVSADGVLTGVAKGRAVITAASSDGSFSDVIEVRVEGIRPVYRALVLGEQTYADGVRLGGENTAQGVADMLRSQLIDGASYEVRLQLDSTRQEVLDGIAAAFGGAGENDVSLFYINCHGVYENGVAYIRLHDESRITVRQLETMLRGISGKIVVILDFCQSGAFIGAGGDFERFSLQAQAAFGASPLTSGRYTVITSASAAEDSYRRAFSSAGGEAGTAAIMGRSLCEGAGWDLIYDRSVSLKADVDRDKLITVQEIYEYTRRRVRHYLEDTGVSQTVYLYPEGDRTVILGRNQK